MDKAPHVSLHSTAHFFLEGLNDLGIDCLFCNFGTDYAPLIGLRGALPCCMARFRTRSRLLGKPTDGTGP